MSVLEELPQLLLSWERRIPSPARSVLRGIGQVFFQANALTGVCFLLGILFSSPVMALGGIVGAAIGWVTARVLRFNESEVEAGLYGFNSTLVGIATFFFFQPGLASMLLLVGGCVIAALLTWLVRRYVPLPTYTAPFIVTTWGLFILGLAVGVTRVEPGGPIQGVGFLGAVAHGVSQVMFQASWWTAVLFLVGIALSDWQHASWVVLGPFVGMLLGSYHATAGARALDPESLVDRALLENVALGLFGYNSSLAAVALFLWRRSLLPPLLGMLIAVPLTELIPQLGLPALTAPFVLASWLVSLLGWLDERLLHRRSSVSV